MARERSDNTWQEDPDDIIILSNRSGNNYIIEMPSGRCRLDAGRRLRTLRSVLEIEQVRDLVEEGLLTIE